MVDTRDLKSLAQWGVRVRAPLPVPLYLENQMYKVYTYKDGKYDYLPAYIYWFMSLLAFSVGITDAGWTLLILGSMEGKFAVAKKRLEFHHETILGR